MRVVVAPSASLVLFWAVGCGGSHSFVMGSGGTASGGSGSGASANAGSAAAGVPAAMAEAGAPPAAGSPCDTEDARQCSEAVPQVCQGGVWVNEAECPEVCTGAGVCACEAGKRKCDGETPQLCDDGQWVAQEACGGAASVCTGEGVCAAYRLLDAGIGSLGARPAEPVAGAKLVLKQQTLSAPLRSCSDQYCVTGDFR
jgi:hypothetical protein